MQVLGTVDECNAVIGLAAAQELPQVVADTLKTVQNTLFVVGSELMASERAGSDAAVPRLTGDEVRHLEMVIDELDPSLPELRNFILPGRTVAAAYLHIARTVCRRTERQVATGRRTEQVSPNVPAYLNRLADLLFVLARYVNFAAEVPGIPWASRG